MTPIFHFHPLPIAQVGPELPLSRRIGDGFFLIWKCTEKVYVFYPAIFVDNNPDRNRIEPVLSEYRVNPSDHVFLARVVFAAHGDSAP
jgi:hypothetical protein